MRLEHEPYKPIYVKLENNFKMVFKDQFPKTDELLKVNKGQKNKFTSPTSQFLLSMHLLKWLCLDSVPL